MPAGYYLKSAKSEKGLSHFHKIIYFMKQTPNIVEYCDFKAFSNDLFIKAMKENLFQKII